MVDLINHPGMFLNAEAAASLKRLEDDHGVQPVTDAGRTKETQQNYINRWNKGGPENRPPNLYEPAKPPETSSHVKNGGEAVDVTNWRWWRDNASEYGWVVDFNWDVVHFRYDPTKDKHINRNAIKNAIKENKMFYAVVGPWNGKNVWYLVVPQANREKPLRAVILGGNAIKGGDLPVISFEWDASISAFKNAAEGVF